MVDSIGRMPVGRIPFSGRKRKTIIAKTKKKMQMWRDKARTNILEQRRRYKLKVELNERLMKSRKEGIEKNLNPSAFSTLPKQKSRPSFNSSTIPIKPRYSDIKPRERIYGNRFKLLEQKKEMKGKMSKRK